MRKHRKQIVFLAEMIDIQLLAVPHTGNIFVAEAHFLGGGQHLKIKDLFAQEAKRQMEAIQQESLAKIDNIFVFDTDAKKIIKQLKLPKDTDLVELAKSIIQSATSGADTGPIGFDEDDLAHNNGKALEDCHYYHLANDQYEVWFNSASMRVYKIKKVK